MFPGHVNLVKKDTSIAAALPSITQSSPIAIPVLPKKTTLPDRFVLYCNVTEQNNYIQTSTN